MYLLDKLKNQLPISKKYVAVFQITFLVFILYLTKFYSYLLFHSLAELVTITVALTIFILIWNSRHYIDNAYFIILGVAFFFSGIIDSFHLFAYKGMNVIGEGSNLATQFWLAARYMMSLSFFAAPLFSGRKPRIGAVFLSYFIATASVFLSVLYWKNFPIAYGPSGLTAFKKISEYIISFFYLAGVLTLYSKRRFFDRRVVILLSASLFLRTIGEFFFTLYVGVYDIFNLFGHLIRIAALYITYLGIVEIALMKPYRLLFKSLKDSEVSARASEERYRTLVEMSPEAIFVHRAGSLVYLNSASLRLFGADTPKALKGKKLWDFIEPADRPRLWEITDSLQEENMNSTFTEVRLKNLKGEIIDTEARQKMIFFEGQAAVQTVMINISSRKIIEKALLEERDRLINILDTMHDGVYIISQNFEIEYVNPALNKVLGEPEGRKCYEYFNGENSRCSWCEADKVFKGQMVRFESNLLKRAGREYDLVQNPLYNRDGSISALAILRDVSEAKKAEKLIRESERRYRTIFENTGAASYLIDDDGYITLANSKFISLSGYEKEEVEGKMKWQEVVHPDDVERMAEYRRLRLVDPVKAPKNYEFKFIRKNGEIRNVYLTVERAPEIKKTVSSILDITDQKKIRGILKASEKRFMAVGELIPFGMWSCDALGAPQYLSRAYLQKIGVSLDEYKKNGWKQIVHPDDWERVKKDWSQCLKEGEAWSHEHRIKDKDGNCYAILSKGTPIKNDSGNIISWTGIDLDITERRKAEVILENANENLGLEVERRTKELKETNTRLIEEIGTRLKVERQLEVRNVVLGFLSRSITRKEYLDSVIDYLKKLTGCHYAGIRLINADDEIPYEAYSGYSQEFYQSENCLSVINDSCVCTRVATGETLPVDKPYLTQYGSFYSGDTLSLEKELSEGEKKNFRGVCIKTGFRTLAVVPIIENGKILGVIHLADEEKDKLDSVMIDNLEKINILLGEGIAKFNLSDEIRRLNQDLEERVLERTAELKKFQLAVENASDLIMITDASGRVLFANYAAETMTGYSLGEIIGRTPTLWGDETAEEFYSEALVKIRESKMPFRAEAVHLRKNGEKFIGELHISPVLSEDREVIFFVGIIRDITEAKEIDRAKSEFISMASHQLRTPLTSIGLSAELLIRGVANQLDNKHQNYLKEIHNSTRRMAELISALLNVSRIEMGTFAVKLEFLEIVSLVDRIIYELGAQISSKKIRLVKTYGVEACEVNFDPNIFRIVFENIVTNAIRYTPEEGEITIGLEKSSSRIILSVKDTGCGIPGEEKEKIFSKSYRSETAKKISSDGTGLGLYIARSVAQKVGADIWLESEEGQGATFYFSIPLSGLGPDGRGQL